MTEQEWLDCPGPYLMLEFLGNRITARKLRLFGCACCRRIWHLLSHQRSRDAVEVDERYADGLASRQEMDEAYAPARTAVEDTPLFPEPDRPWINNNVAGYHAAWAAVWLLSENIASWQASTEATKAVRGARRDGEEDAVSPERHKQATLLRCIVGNPFRAVSRDPAWLACWKYLPIVVTRMAAVKNIHYFLWKSPGSAFRGARRACRRTFGPEA
jgi:hypothetical protein